MVKRNIQWHNGFVAAMRLECDDEQLEFTEELILNTGALRVDVLICKKNRNYSVQNEIGYVFRGHNLIEYKSPDDVLDENTLYKTIAYACLYKSYNMVSEDEITISLIRQRKPKRLLKYIKKYGYGVSAVANGIYYIGGFAFPIQIVVLSEVEYRQHIWLSALNNNLELSQAKDLIVKSSRVYSEQPEKYEYVDSVIQISFSANKEIYCIAKEEVPGMCEALRELMADEIKEEMTKARVQGLAEGRAEGHAKGRAEGRAEGCESTYNAFSLVIKGFDTVEKLVRQGVPESEAIKVLEIWSQR